MACIVLWTKEEEAMIRQLIEAGVGLRDAVPVFKGRSREAIRNKTAAMGLVWPMRKADVDHDLFKQLIKDAGKKKCI